MAKRSSTSLSSALWRGTTVLAICAFSLGCGNGGRIDFHPEVTNHHNRGAATTMVPGSKALVVETAKTPATGYHAKLQLSSRRGTTLTSGDGHKLKLKHAVRNR